MSAAPDQEWSTGGPAARSRTRSGFVQHRRPGASGGLASRGADGLERTPWRKSSHSEGKDGCKCVEVRFVRSGGIEIRDSTYPDGPVLSGTARAWILFIHNVKRNDL